MKVSYQSIIDEIRPVQGILDLQRAEIGRIFLSVQLRFGLNKRDAKLGASTIFARYEELLKNCVLHNIAVSFVQVSWLKENIFENVNNKILFDERTTALTECCRICRMTGCKYIVIEMPFNFIHKEDEAELFQHLIKCAEIVKNFDITLLLKNETKKISGHIVRGFCSQVFDAINWLEHINKKMEYEAYGFCLDTGNCNLCGINMQDFIDRLGTRLKVIILSDNDGQNEASMLPFTYTYDGNSRKHWLGAIRGLRDINFNGELAIGYGSTAKSFSPLLKMYLLPLVREVGNYFKWQIELESFLKKTDKIVLFGAGNMCRNYMKSYGDKYPPLFTCDNNPGLWNTVFAGLSVKNPEELKRLSADCMVIICNVYYYEIEMQLRNMGIKNIGYFNDEFMPSFYYDRVEREEQKKDDNGHWRADSKCDRG